MARLDEWVLDYRQGLVHENCQGRTIILLNFVAGDDHVLVLDSVTSSRHGHDQPGNQAEAIIPKPVGLMLLSNI